MSCKVPLPRAANWLSTWVLGKCLEGLSLPRISGINVGLPMQISLRCLQNSKRIYTVPAKFGVHFLPRMKMLQNVKNAFKRGRLN